MERRRTLGTFYILYIATLTFWIAFDRLHDPNGWTPGDWLINYEGGFVRRGLPGQAILLTAHALHLSPIVLATFVPLLFYGLIYLCVWILYQRSSGRSWTIAALLSPATLAFPILDSVGGFRKEAIFLAGLAILLVYLMRPPVRNLYLALYLSVVPTVAILSHEALVPYFLYYVAALFIALRNPKRIAKIAILPCIVAAISFYAVVHHKGDMALQQNICQSLGAVPPIVCGGAIAYLANGTDVAHQDVIRNLHAYHYLRYFPIVTLLALLPFAFGIATLWRNRRLRPSLFVLCTAALIASAASIPLFLYAMDWGRWIYIHIFSVFLLLAFLDTRTQPQRSIRLLPPTRRVATISSSPSRRWLTLAALLLYTTCWNIPHYGNFPKKGYFNKPLHLLKQKLGLAGPTPENPRDKATS